MVKYWVHGRFNIWYLDGLFKVRWCCRTKRFFLVFFFLTSCSCENNESPTGIFQHNKCIVKRRPISSLSLRECGHTGSDVTFTLLQQRVVTCCVTVCSQAKSRGVEEARDQMFSGEKINFTEVIERNTHPDGHTLAFVFSCLFQSPD